MIKIDEPEKNEKKKVKCERFQKECNVNKIAKKE